MKPVSGVKRREKGMNTSQIVDAHVHPLPRVITIKGLLKELDAAKVDVAAVPYTLTEEDYVKKVRETVGFNRVLFGSDYPVIRGTTIKSLVTTIENSPYLICQEKEMIFYKNAVKLIGSLNSKKEIGIAF